MRWPWGAGRVKSDRDIAQREVTLAPLDSMRLPVFVTVDRAGFRGSFDVTVDVTDDTSGRHRQAKARFLGPQGRQ